MKHNYNVYKYSFVRIRENVKVQYIVEPLERTLNCKYREANKRNGTKFIANKYILNTALKPNTCIQGIYRGITQ